MLLMMALMTKLSCIEYKYRNKIFDLWYINSSYSALYPPYGLLGFNTSASRGLLPFTGNIIDINVNIIQ